MKCCFKSTKDYEPPYVWGQLIGWFKQTVDKPNASLSADRRGTLSYPDLESFIIEKRKKKKNGRGSTNKKRGDQAADDEDDELMVNTTGTKSRPVMTTPSSLVKDEDGSPMSDGGDIEEKKREYPHKKYKKREDFLEKWKNNFSKQWDVNCKWSFKNK